MKLEEKSKTLTKNKQKRNLLEEDTVRCSISGEILSYRGFWLIDACLSTFSYIFLKKKTLLPKSSFSIFPQFFNQFFFKLRRLNNWEILYIRRDRNMFRMASVIRHAPNSDQNQLLSALSKNFFAKWIKETQQLSRKKETSYRNTH